MILTGPLHALLQTYYRSVEPRLEYIIHTSYIAYYFATVWTIFLYFARLSYPGSEGFFTALDDFLSIG